MKQFKSLLAIVCTVILLFGAGANGSAAQYNEDIKIVKVKTAILSPRLCNPRNQ